MKTMCMHLKQLEEYIISKGIKETWRGQAWSKHCCEWIYFDCLLDVDNLNKNFHFDSCIALHDYFDVKGGSELGFICKICNEGIMGLHSKNPLSSGKPVIK